MILKCYHNNYRKNYNIVWYLLCRWSCRFSFCLRLLQILFKLFDFGVILLKTFKFDKKKQLPQGWGPTIIMNVLDCSKRSDGRVQREIRERRRKKARGREEGGSFTGVHFCPHPLKHPLFFSQLTSASRCPHNNSMRALEWRISWGWRKVVWEKTLHNKMTN